MTEKDIVKLNEEELKQVAGGALYLNPKQGYAFFEIGTAEEAAAFLIQCGVLPSQKNYHIYMDKWMEKNGN